MCAKNVKSERFRAPQCLRGDPREEFEIGEGRRRAKRAIPVDERRRKSGESRREGGAGLGRRRRFASGIEAQEID